MCLFHASLIFGLHGSAHPNIGIPYISYDPYLAFPCDITRTLKSIASDTFSGLINPESL